MLALADTRKAFWHVFDIYWVVGAVVFVLVVGALVGVALRFRSNADEYPGGRDEWPAAEYGWLTLIACVAAALLYVTFSTMGREKDAIANVGSVKPATPAGALSVRVEAAQWSWRFVYPGGVVVAGDHLHPPTLVVPAGRPVHFDITSLDVVHAFWILDRKLKVDAFPQRTTVANLIWPSPGAWRAGGTCDQFCGLYHSTMTFDVRALDAAGFAGWLTARSRP